MSIRLKKEHFVGEPSYIVFQSDDGLYYAVNQKTKDILAKSADAATVIQQAINAITSGRIILKGGVYDIDKPIKLKSYITIEGEIPNSRGRDSDVSTGTVLNVVDSIDSVFYSDPSVVDELITIKNLRIQVQLGKTLSYGIKWKGVRRSRIENVQIESAKIGILSDWGTDEAANILSLIHI